MIKKFEAYQKNILSNIYLKNKDIDIREFERMFFKMEDTLSFFEDIHLNSDYYGDYYEIKGTRYTMYESNSIDYIENFWINTKNTTQYRFFDFYEFYEVLDSEELFEKYPEMTAKLYRYIVNELKEIIKREGGIPKEYHAWYEKLELIKYQLDMTEVEKYVEAEKYNL
jgi:hypothetical protein